MSTPPPPARPPFRRGFSLALKGFDLAIHDREIKRTYRRLFLWLSLVVLALDAAGIYGLWHVTQMPADATGWMVAAIWTGRVVGLLAVLLIAPMLSIFVSNIVMPMFNEKPFFAGLRALNPERAAALESQEGTSFGTQVWISVVRLGVLIAYVIIGLAVSAIPLVGTIAGPLVGVYLAARLLGWELLDPYFARRNMGLKQQRAFLRQHGKVVLGFAAPYAAAFSIPFIGPLLFGIAQAAVAILVERELEA